MPDSPLKFVQNDDRVLYLGMSKTAYPAVADNGSCVIFQVPLTNNDTKNLTSLGPIPENFSAVSISFESATAVAGQPIARYSYFTDGGAYLSDTFGNPVWQGTYIELVTNLAMNSFQFRRCQAVPVMVTIQFYNPVPTN